jgi:hypothetical protein
MNQQEKEYVVHQKRMKRAFKHGIWKEKDRERCRSKQRKIQPEREEEEQVEIAHRPVTIPVPLEGNKQQVPGIPNRRPKSDLDTPSTAPQISESREIRRYPTFVPTDTPVTTHELGTTRPHPPTTRLQSTLHALEGIAEQLGE